MQKGDANHSATLVQFLDRHLCHLLVDDAGNAGRERSPTGSNRAMLRVRSRLGKKLLEIKTSTTLAALGLATVEWFQGKGVSCSDSLC